MYSYMSMGFDKKFRDINPNASPVKSNFPTAGEPV